METRTATKLATGQLVRTAQLDRKGLDKEKRTITVRFSTETPVKRWFGEETLSHDPGAVKLDRMKNGAAVLCEHDPNQRCGITESASITPDKNGEAVVRFARTPLGDQCMNEVEDGTLRWVSVGYVVNRFEVNDKEDEYRAIDWEPLEVSFVGIPADPNARVLRSNTTDTHESIVMKRTLLHQAKPEDGNGNPPAPQAPNVITHEDFSRDLNESKEIFDVALQYQRTHPEVVEEARRAIKDKTPVKAFYRKVMEMTTKPSTERAEILPHKQATAGSRSVGGRFVESEAYKAAMKRGGISRGNHISIDLPDMFTVRNAGLSQRAVTFGIGTSDISTSTDVGGTGGSGVDIHQAFNLLGQQPVAVSDLFAQGTTSGDVVRYVRELSFTVSAARVGEAGAIPQQDLDVGVINATVEKTAAFTKTTREMLNDQGQASSFINSRLGYSVQIKEDSYLLNGTGASQITGILNFTGIQTVSGATNPIDNLLVGKAKVEGAAGSGFAMPDCYIMHPLDFLSVRLTKDSNGQYLFGGPAYSPYGYGGYSNVGQLWGLPVVTTTVITRGTALVGAFRMGAQIFRRQGLTIETTDSDGTDFQNDVFTVRATSRFTLACYQPNKFCTITDLPA